MGLFSRLFESLKNIDSRDVERVANDLYDVVEKKTDEARRKAEKQAASQLRQKSDDQLSRGYEKNKDNPVAEKLIRQEMERRKK
ncbi:MAG: hypothetical protein Q4F28_00740 [Eubacteriales bacterium]|nr:hypothetical protein [Eubacteriales bacterium]